MTELTALERAVLSKFLAGEHPVLDQLRRQLGTCRVSNRTTSGVGFFTEFACTADVEPPIVFDTTLRVDVHAEVDGLEYGAGFLLFIKRGRLDMLEGFTNAGEPWPGALGLYELVARSYNEHGRLNLPEGYDDGELWPDSIGERFELEYLESEEIALPDGKPLVAWRSGGDRIGGPATPNGRRWVLRQLDEILGREAS